MCAYALYCIFQVCGENQTINVIKHVIVSQTRKVFKDVLQYR